jgi:hypothetical protein
MLLGLVSVAHVTRPRRAVDEAVGQVLENGGYDFAGVASRAGVREGGPNAVGLHVAVGG